MRDVALALARNFPRTGPVIRMPGYTILLGPRANLFLGSSADRLFNSGDFYRAFARQLGADRFVVAMDGEPHRRMRRVMHPAFTMEAVERYLPSMRALTEEALGSWERGERVSLEDFFRRLITEQTTRAMTGRGPGVHFGAISRFFKTAVGSTLGRYDEPALNDPEYLKARAEVHALIREMLEDHRRNAGRDEPDYIDLLLSGTDENDELLTEEEQIAAALVPFFAGIDTVAYTCCFMLYEILHNRDLHQRLMTEVDAGFQNPTADLEALKTMPLLRRTVIETLRLYPVAPPAVRTVVKNFEFAGHTITEGERVVVATPATHFMEDLFPDPLCFDPDRHAPPRLEHRKPGAFIPFFKGPHTCIGAGMGEMQIMLTIGTILQLCDLALDPPGYSLQMAADPVLRPINDLSVRVEGVRAVHA